MSQIYILYFSLYWFYEFKSPPVFLTPDSSEYLTHFLSSLQLAIYSLSSSFLSVPTFIKPPAGATASAPLLLKHHFNGVAVFHDAQHLKSASKQVINTAGAEKREMLGDLWASQLKN